MSSSQLYIPKNKYLFDNKSDALVAIANMKLADGETQAVRYKNAKGELETFLLIGTPTGLNIINNIDEINKKLNELEKEATETKGNIYWDEF